MAGQAESPTGHVFRVECVHGPVWYAKHRLPEGRHGDPVAAIRRVAPNGVDRIVEVSFSDNIDLDAAVAAAGAVIAAYATLNPRPAFDF